MAAQHNRVKSYDSNVNGSVISGSSPTKKSIVGYQRADLNDFTKGISDMKVAYVPHFGHDTIQYGISKGPWSELSKNILNSYAPKHSAILEFV